MTTSTALTASRINQPTIIRAWKPVAAVVGKNSSNITCRKLMTILYCRTADYQALFSCLLLWP
ncbi:hypothetical protein NC652_013981 [Populus alba x Populus x berolinensis]|nr:hypothetical protein NC652_013981 [Populus alba x Populus x berolinensis]